VISSQILDLICLKLGSFAMLRRQFYCPPNLDEALYKGFTAVFPPKSRHFLSVFG
jgi:hypothetical protein